MTFDDGILQIYREENTAENGAFPKMETVLVGEYYYKIASLGYNRAYAAMQNNQTIDQVVDIPEWNDIEATSLVDLEDGKRYKITLVQKLHDENNLQYTKLTLERVVDLDV